LKEGLGTKISISPSGMTEATASMVRMVPVMSFVMHLTFPTPISIQKIHFSN